ncbi:MAG: hypothetical protein JWM85_2123 [Acidimicrobiaceae bacterium]|nr:hypothetical protein [Acidimicrobiaceae bacterium]
MTTRAPVTPQISARRRINSLLRWSAEPDRTAATAPARRAFLDRFEKEVDPEMRLSPDDRAKRAECLRKAYFIDLGLRSAAARRARGKTS